MQFLLLLCCHGEFDISPAWLPGKGELTPATGNRQRPDLPLISLSGGRSLCAPNPYRDRQQQQQQQQRVSNVARFVLQFSCPTAWKLPAFEFGFGLAFSLYFGWLLAVIFFLANSVFGFQFRFRFEFRFGFRFRFRGPFQFQM